MRRLQFSMSGAWQTALSAIVLSSILVASSMISVPASEREIPVPKAKPIIAPPQNKVGIVRTSQSARRNACWNQLANTGISAKWIGTKKQRFCTLKSAVKVQSVVVLGKKIQFAAEPTVSCEFALTLGKWTKEFARANAKIKGSRLNTIYTGPGFDCRRRNRAKTGKLSEHAKGNAIDVIAIGFADGQKSNIGRAKNRAHKALQKSMRRIGCQSFSTVLGPGYNAAHATHLHFDDAKRRNNFRLCK